MTYPLNYNYFFPFFGEQARKQIPNYKLTKGEKIVLLKLAIYFFDDHFLAKEYDIDLNKGIALFGPIGCGKSKLMELMHEFYKAKDFPKCFFNTVNCKHIINQYEENGPHTVYQYSKDSIYKNNIWVPQTFCFDDFGAERPYKHFGNEINVMEEILTMRYEYFKSKSMKTYLTTNLNFTEIEQVYGARLVSRLREMCNLITFPNDSLDKRKL